jgi:hypothetical protein
LQAVAFKYNTMKKRHHTLKKPATKRPGPRKIVKITALRAGLAAIKAQFPPATGTDIAAANKPDKPKFKPEKKRDWAHLPPSERVKLAISGRTKKVKLKRQFWDAPFLIQFMRDHQINAAETNWLFTSNEGKISPRQQLDLFLTPDDVEFIVQCNAEKMVLQIETLKGEG